MKRNNLTYFHDNKMSPIFAEKFSGLIKLVNCFLNCRFYIKNGKRLNKSVYLSFEFTCTNFQH